MTKKIKKPAEKDIELDNVDITPEHVVDDTVDEEVLKVLKPPKPRPIAHKPVIDKHDYVAELERDEQEFDI